METPSWDEWQAVAKQHEERRRAVLEIEVGPSVSEEDRALLRRLYPNARLVETDGGPE